jgi:hypothetical protein
VLTGTIMSNYIRSARGDWQAAFNAYRQRSLELGLTIYRGSRGDYAPVRPPILESSRP